MVRRTPNDTGNGNVLSSTRLFHAKGRAGKARRGGRRSAGANRGGRNRGARRRGNAGVVQGTRPRRRLPQDRTPLGADAGGHRTGSRGKGRSRLLAGPGQSASGWPGSGWTGRGCAGGFGNSLAALSCRTMGRAWCREGWCRSVEVSVGGLSLKKKQKKLI